MSRKHASTRFGRALLSVATAVASPHFLMAQVKTDGSVGPARSLTGPSYTVGAELGTQRGGNLFHSFKTLNVNRGESLTFTGPTDVTNILARVTGGKGTTINGTLASTIDGANLFLINPNGIIFGEHARLDVSGSFVATTADVVKLQDGGSFNARVPAESVLTSAPATAFGFLGPNSNASLRVRGSREAPARLVTAEGTGLSLVAQSIDVQRARIFTPGGPFSAAAVTSGDVNSPSDQPGRVGSISVGATRGPIVVRNRSLIDATSFVGGAVELAGEDLTIKDSAILSSNIFSTVDLPCGDMTIDLTGRLFIDNGRAATQTRTLDVSFPSLGKAGDVTVNAKSVKATHGGVIGSVAIGNQLVGGNSGSVSITADDVSFDGRNETGTVGGVAAGSALGGDAGDITINAKTLSLTGGSELEASTFGLGAGGDVNINADRVFIASPRPTPTDDPSGPEPFHGIRATVLTVGDDPKSGGTIRIQTKSLEMQDAAVISAAALGSGDAGAINITADKIYITGDGGETFVGINTSTSASGVNDDGSLFRGGRAGDVTINAGTLRLARNGAIVAAGIPATADGEGPVAGDAGNIVINADRLILNGDGGSDTARAGIVANAGATQTPSGAAGNVTLNVKTMRVFNGGLVTSETNGFGEAGTVNITARDLLVDGEVPDSIPGESSSSRITSSSVGGFSDGGDLTIVAKRLAVTNGAAVASNSQGDGNGGNLNITADTFILSGTPAIEDTGGAIVGAVSIGGAGSGGTITINVGSMAVQNGATLAAAAVGGAGDGGRLIIRADDLKVDGGPKSKETIIGVGILDAGTGAGGQADIQVAGEVTVRRGAIVLAGTEGSGPGGDLAIDAGRAIYVNAGTISAASGDLDEDNPSVGTGPAGSVSLTAPYLRIEGSSEIAATSEQSSGGSITLSGDNIDLLRSTIRVNAATTGGSVVLRFTDRIYAFKSQINAVGNDAIGTIDIDPQFTVLNQSSLLTDTRPGGGGNINIVTDQLLQAQSTITAAGVIQIDVLRADTDVTAGLLQLRGDLFDASKALKEACGKQVGGDVSSFIVEGRGGMPIEPGAALPSNSPTTRPAE